MPLPRIRPATIVRWQAGPNFSGESRLMIGLDEVDRRIVSRVPGIGVRELAVEVNGASFPATARDISIKGVGLLMRCQIEVGTVVTIKRGPELRALAAPLAAE